MTKKIIVTANGPDKPGLVERITGIIKHFEGNIETSQMTRLVGEFEILILVVIDDKNGDDLLQSLNQSSAEDLTICARYATEHPTVKLENYIPYDLQVKGADHPGIINEITAFLYQKGINIISMSSTVEPSPFSGANLFSMQAQIMVPPDVTISELRKQFSRIEKETNVEIRIEVAQH